MKRCYSCMSKIDNAEATCPNCNNPIDGRLTSRHHLQPGTILGGRYNLGYAIGEGGFGITYIGMDERLETKVAVKEYYPTGMVTRIDMKEVEAIPTEKTRVMYANGKDKFLQEARTLAKFADETSIVSVRDFFEENNTAYIVMEYLNGMSLNEYLRRKGTIEPETTIKILYPIMKTLQIVHKENLIHRDISPDNIMITRNGAVLTDFGDARYYVRDDEKSLSVMLKHGYAPIEQYSSTGEPGPWSDVYALCATIYKCITGLTPPEAMGREIKDSLRSPSSIGVSLAPFIENAIMHGLELDQRDRIQSIDELLRELRIVRKQAPKTDSDNAEKNGEHAEQTGKNVESIAENTESVKENAKPVAEPEVDKVDAAQVAEPEVVAETTTPKVEVSNGIAAAETILEVEEAAKMLDDSEESEKVSDDDSEEATKETENEGSTEPETEVEEIAKPQEEEVDYELLESQYQESCNTFDAAASLEDYKQCMILFERTRDYKDSEDYIAKCNKKVDDILFAGEVKKAKEEQEEIEKREIIEKAQSREHIFAFLKKIAGIVLVTLFSILILRAFAVNQNTKSDSTNINVVDTSIIEVNKCSLDDIDVEYTGYDSRGAYFEGQLSVTAETGKKLVAVSFVLINNSDTDRYIDIGKYQFKYKFIDANEEQYPNIVTSFSNDFSTYFGSVTKDSPTPTVLIFQVPEETSLTDSKVSFVSDEIQAEFILE